jgi:hypothetical protein
MNDEKRGALPTDASEPATKPKPIALPFLDLIAALECGQELVIRGQALSGKTGCRSLHGWRIA